MKLYKFLLILAVLSGSGTTHAFAAGKVAYNCPDLHDDKKRTIEQLNQGYDGWFFRNNDLKMDFSISPEAASYISRLNAELANQRTELVIMPLLSRAMMASKMVNHEDPWQENYDVDLAKSSYVDFIKQLKDTGVGIVDLSTLYGTYDSSNPYDYNFMRDIHWKPEGAKIIADAAAKYLETLEYYPSLPKADTSSSKKEEIGRAGTIREEIQRLCRGEIEPETFTTYKVTRKSEGSASDLFGESATVPLSLVGTSFSAVDEFNFVGFLEEESKLAVVNFSIAGGEMFASLLSYLSSPYFQENTPKVLLWETQSVYDFNKGTEYDFRQAIPAVRGPCEGANVLASRKLSIPTGAEVTLVDGIKEKVTGSDYYLHLYADNPNFKKFDIEFGYDDEDGELFPVDRGDRFDNKGHFYIELSDRILGNLSSVKIKDASVTSNVDVQFCRKKAADVQNPEQQKGNKKP
jgi:hypothetical protein